MIKVKATQVGFYVSYRKPGDVFDIKDKEAFSVNWMETVKAGDIKAKPEPEPEKIEDEFSEMDDDKLIAYAKANCPGLTLTKTMKDSTMRDRIRAFKPM